MKQTLFQFIIVLFFYSPLFANNYTQTVLTLELYDHPYWYKLLHFEDGKSLINNKDFFLSLNGQNNPKEELLETLAQFLNNPQTICQYPARYKWLKRKLGLTIQKPRCKELNTFLKPGYQRISLIYSTERYNAPASVFGHIMLKVESNTIPYVINYVAKVPDKENQLVYAYRGLTGKYKGQYKVVPYNIKDYEYIAQEFRDLIIFGLNFTQDEIENIILHLFEVRNTNQDYYFLSRNCGSEILKFLDLTREGLDLSSDLNRITIPAEIIFEMEKNDLVQSMSRKISKLKQFYSYINQLQRIEIDILLQIIRHKSSVGKLERNSLLSPEVKEKIISASILYFEIEAVQGVLDPKNMYPLLKLINLKLKYSIESKLEKEIILKDNPISNRFHRASIGAGHNGSKDVAGLTFGYRYLYRHRFDLIDDTKENGSVELVDISMRVRRKKVSLDYITLLNLESIPTSTIFFSQTTRKMTIGGKRLFSNEVLYSYLDYGVGHNYELTSNVHFNYYFKGGAYYKVGNGMLLAAFEPSIEYNFNNKFAFELKYEINKYTNAVLDQNVYLNIYYKVSRSSTLSLVATRKNYESDYSNISFRYHFNF